MHSSVLSSQAHGGLSKVANYGWLPVVRRCARGCREAGISAEPAVGQGESEISPVTPRGKCREKDCESRSNRISHTTVLFLDQILCLAWASRSHETHSYIRLRQVTDLSQALTHLHRYTGILSCSKEIAAWLALSLTLGANHLLCSYLQPPSCKITSTGTSRGRDMPESSRKNCRLPAIC